MDEDTTNQQQKGATQQTGENQTPIQNKQVIKPTQTNDLSKAKEEAILAMEGEEGRLRREKAEKEKKTAKMLAELDEEKKLANLRLEAINKEKEKLELKWIEMSDKKKEFQKILEPIVLSEMNIEKDVQSKNQEEHATEDPVLRQPLEKERQELETKRQAIEKNKWSIEDEITKLNVVMNENKVKYQELLNEEFSLEDKTVQIEEKIKSIKIV